MNWAELVDPGLENAADNVRSVLTQATDAELLTGASWYAETREELRQLGSQLGFDLKVTAGVFAALSPANRIDQNWIDTRNLLEAAREVDSEEVPDWLKVSTWHRNKRLAWQIARGDAWIDSPKCGAFVQNLLGNEDVVTVDRHAFNVAIGEQLVISEKGPKITTRRYQLVAEAYRQVAEEFGLSPAQVQAITWLTWRRLLVS